MLVTKGGGRQEKKKRKKSRALKYSLFKFSALNEKYLLVQDKIEIRDPVARIIHLLVSGGNGYPNKKKLITLSRESNHHFKIIGVEEVQGDAKRKM